MSENATPVQTKTTADTRPVQPWRVVLLNDDYTTTEFVYQVLVEIFDMDPGQAVDTTCEVHDTGSALAGTYPKEMALRKVSDTLRVARANGHPLMLVAEAG